MLLKFYLSLTLILSLFFASNLKVYAQKSNAYSSNELLRSNNLIINQLTPNSYQHISYLQTNDFGLVPCNGLIVRDRNEVIIFDTPINDKSAEELIKWITTSIGCKIKAVIPTHFHEDCLGGLGAFIQKNIPSYGFYKTIALAKENNSNIPKNSFKNILKLKVGNERVIVRFFGEGHTKDNVVGYFTKDQILFGGCLIKEMDASEGFLGDANIKEWSATVGKVKNAFPDVKIVVPGHGIAGDIKLLDYTISLFK